MSKQQTTHFECKTKGKKLVCVHVSVLYVCEIMLIYVHLSTCLCLVSISCVCVRMRMGVCACVCMMCLHVRVTMCEPVLLRTVCKCQRDGFT